MHLFMTLCLVTGNVSRLLRGGRMRFVELLGSHDVATFCPGVVKGGHFLYLIRVGFREVLEFGSIPFGVIQLPSLRMTGNQLPGAQPHGPVALMLPENGR